MSCWNKLWLLLPEAGSTTSVIDTGDAQENVMEKYFITELKQMPVCQNIPGIQKILYEYLIYWTRKDFNDVGYKILTEKEIAAYVQYKEAFIEEIGEELCLRNGVTYREVGEMLTKCIRWF